MGHLIKGKWNSGNVITSDEKGEFDREESKFRSTIGKDSEFKPEKDRYHLYVSYACPWAHRTLITRALKGLEDIISVSVVSPDMLENSWSFEQNFPKVTTDSVYGKKYLYEVYQEHDPNISCKVTVPLLWDRKLGKIVNNESSEILRILDSEFGEFANADYNLYPEIHREEIGKINDLVYESINNGVYKTGFAKNQKAYEKNFNALFEALDQIEKHLEGRDFLVSDSITEADVRLITTLLRFDAVYFTHFKCNKKMIRYYKNLGEYTRRLYSIEAIKSTTHIDHIKRHYFYSHDFINPTRVVPSGPVQDF